MHTRINSKLKAYHLHHPATAVKLSAKSMIKEFRINRETVTSQTLWSRYDRHSVGITRRNAWGAKIYRVIQIKLNQLF